MLTGSESCGDLCCMRSGSSMLLSLERSSRLPWSAFLSSFCSTETLTLQAHGSASAPQALPSPGSPALGSSGGQQDAQTALVSPGGQQGVQLTSGTQQSSEEHLLLETGRAARARQHAHLCRGRAKAKPCGHVSVFLTAFHTRAEMQLHMETLF